MLVPLAYLFDRVAGPASRAIELRDVRRRLVAEPGPGDASRAEEELAVKLRDLRVRLAASFASAEHCASCEPAPSAGFSGGHCCSAATAGLWNDDELGALRLAGTKPSDLKAPRGAHLGCAFRGSFGCSVPAEHRPCVCVGYACRELRVELGRRGCGARYAQLEAELHSVFDQFVARRRERLQASLFGELEAGLVAATRRGGS